jgi:hypothetical protein
MSEILFAIDWQYVAKQHQDSLAVLRSSVVRHKFRVFVLEVSNV